MSFRIKYIMDDSIPCHSGLLQLTKLRKVTVKNQWGTAVLVICVTLGGNIQAGLEFQIRPVSQIWRCPQFLWPCITHVSKNLTISTIPMAADTFKEDFLTVCPNFLTLVDGKIASWLCPSNSIPTYKWTKYTPKELWCPFNCFLIPLFEHLVREWVSILTLWASCLLNERWWNYSPYALYTFVSSPRRGAI